HFWCACRRRQTGSMYCYCRGSEGERMLGRLIVALLMATAALPAAAQQYPARPIRIVVPFAVGGPSDVMARVIAQKLTEIHGRQIVVDNRVGAGGNIGI